MSQYKTIGRESEVRMEISQSEFIGVAFPLKNDSDPESLLDTVKKRYPGATHYVYAYRKGQPHALQKFSDDGEPYGTGGMPIMELLKCRQLEDAMVVVVRYYGGVKLGTGGLKRAYSAAAQEALNGATPILLTACWLIRIFCPYPFWGKVQYELEKQQILLEEIHYQEDVKILAAVREDQAESFSNWIRDLTALQAVIVPEKRCFRRLQSRLRG